MDGDQSDGGSSQAGMALYPEGRRVIFIYALGREPSALAPVIAPLQKRFFRHKPVFLHTSLDFRPFMEAKVAFEHFPSLEQIAGFPGLTDWPRYLKDRRDLLIAKWGPSRAISYGIDFADYLAQAQRIVDDHE